MASTTITKASYSFNRRKFTISCWVKRSILGAKGIINIYLNGNNYSVLEFNSSDQLIFKNRGNSTTNAEVVTDAQFRDIHGWYHIVLRVDTFDATSNNRVRLYVNGVQQTNLATNTQPSQDGYMEIGQSTTHTIGAGVSGGYWDGCISHFHITDGYSYGADSFGSTDSITGEWNIKTSPSVTYGSGGTFILKDGNSVTDQSGNSNNWTVATGTLSKTEDCPSNVFCTMNPLNPKGNVSYSNGNNVIDVADNNNSAGTIGVNSGKYYYEVKQLNTVANGWIGEGNINSLGSNLNGEGSGWLSFSNLHGTIYYNGNSDTTPSAGSNNDIIGCAVDFDNGKIYWHQNGTYISTTGGQQNPTTEANPITFTTGNDFWFPVVGSYSSNPTAQLNFGNGFFGTTAVSSAGTNASNNGIFEYDVPAGYTALSTKGLNL